MSRQPEKELVVYGPFHNTFFNILRSFRSNYPQYDINLTYYAAHPTTVIEKVRAEVKNGIPTADVVMLPHYATLQLKMEGYLKKYFSDQLSVYPSKFKDEDGMWSAIAVEPTKAIYNPSIINRELVPTKLEDIANPDFRGKFAIQSVTDWSEGMYSFYYFATLLELIGEKRWESIIKEFIENVKPKTFPCYHNMHKYIARGDYGIGLPLPLIKVGWSVETVNLKDVPATASVRSIAILTNGAHQISAELFYDYLLSEAWQNKMGKDYEGLIPTMQGAKMKYGAQFKDGLTYFPTERHVREAASYLEKFKQVGLP